MTVDLTDEEDVDWFEGLRDEEDENEDLDDDEDSVDNEDEEDNEEKQEIVDSGSGQEDSHDVQIEGYPELPPDNARPELVELLKAISEDDEFDPLEQPVLFELLQDSAPAYKMPKSAVNYTEDDAGEQVCANCEYAYRGMDGRMICSQVRGEIKGEAWCNLFELETRDGKSNTESQSQSESTDGSQSVDKVDSHDSRYVATSSEKVRQTARMIPPTAFTRLSKAFREQVWPDELSKSRSWAGNEDVDKELQEWIDSVVRLRDPVYDEYTDIPMAAGLTVEKEITDSLTQHQGWSIDSIDRRLRREFDHLEPRSRERIVRTETAAVLNMAKRTMIEARGDNPDVKWVGPDDRSTTGFCEELSNKTEDGMPYNKFLQLYEELVGKYDNTSLERADELIAHIGCRHTVEMVE